MDRDEDHLSFGVFKPVGHVVASFPTEGQASAAREALKGNGWAGDEVRHLSDRQMIEQADHDLAHGSPIAAIGQEFNLVRAQRALAEKGYHFLIVRARSDEKAARAADLMAGQGAERAQHYGTFIIEDLIDRPGNLSQVAESPDRGLDAQTPSGLETEAGDIKAQLEGRR